MGIIDIKIRTKDILSEWQNVEGFAPDTVINKLDRARLDRLEGLTECLDIWVSKHYFLTDSELLLARANLGAVVESWLKFFYCIYYESYCNEPVKNGKGNMIEPNDLSFEKLKIFSRDKLWNAKGVWEEWIDKIQYRRNAIHSFNDREIGTIGDFLEDINKLNEFIELIYDHLPAIEFPY